MPGMVGMRAMTVTTMIHVFSVVMPGVHIMFTSVMVHVFVV